jgi:uncharacterized membrane protein
MSWLDISLFALVGIVVVVSVVALIKIIFFDN